MKGLGNNLVRTRRQMEGKIRNERVRVDQMCTYKGRW